MKTKTCLTAVLSLMLAMLLGTTTVQAEDGWIDQDGYWYYVSNGDYVENDWVYYNGDYYFLDYEGRMVTNSEHYINGHYYRFNESGKMITGWYEEKYDEESDWYYYLEGSGKAASGVTTVGSKEYYFSYDGRMLRNYNYTSNEKIIKTDANGVVTANVTLKEGWNAAGGNWYYVQNGELVRYDWIYDGGNYYYFNYEGMVKDTTYWIDDYCYRFDKSGKMITGWYEMKYEWSDESYWYYYLPSGKAATGLTEVKGVKYYFDYEGEMIRNYFYISDEKAIATDKNGVVYVDKPLTNGWNAIGEEWCYVENGKVVKEQWLGLNGKWYYFGYDGMMYRYSHHSIYNENTDSYDYYGFDESGKMVTGWFTYVNKDGYKRTYYYTPSGKAGSGIVEIDGTKYYLEYNGRFYRDWTTVTEGTTLYVIENGIVTVEKTFTNGWNEFKGNWYFVENDVILRNQFKEIGNYTYYFTWEGHMAKNTSSYEIWSDEYGEASYGFDADGHMIKGWYDWGTANKPNWYYYNLEDGRALHGVQVIDGKKYYLNYYGRVEKNIDIIYGDKIISTDANGIVQKEDPIKEGWNAVGKYWCYVEDGNLLYEELKTIGNKTYYFNGNGYMITNKHTDIYISGEGWTYYGFGPDGVALNGWKQWSNDGGYETFWAYYENGKAVTGPRVISNKKYLFSSSGELLENYTGIYNNIGYITDASGVVKTEKTLTNGWFQLGEYWYYVENNQLIRDSFKTINGNTYYFGWQGTMYKDQTISIYEDGQENSYRFNSSGVMVKGWYQSKSGDWYYYNQDGKGAYGELTIGGTKYLFDGNAYLLTNYCGRFEDVFYTTNKDGKVTDKKVPVEKWNQYDGHWYYVIDGEFVEHDVINIGGTLYAFDHGGEMFTSGNFELYDYETGKSNLYGIDANGKAIINGWSNYYPGQWYYHGADGTAIQGWKKFNTSWYYFNYYMMADVAVEIDGKLQLFDQNGVWIGEGQTVNGWNLISGYYYYAENGKLAHGWKKIGSSWYYFDDYGRMANREFYSIYDEEDDRYHYYSFTSSGAMVTNSWVGTSYAKASGELARNEWLLIGGKWYYFDYYDIVETNTVIDGTLYYFNDNGTYTGKSAKVSSLNGWVDINGHDYYFENGKAVDGWKALKGYWYYFENGWMATGVHHVAEDDAYYYFGTNGKLVTKEGLYINEEYRNDEIDYYVYVQNGGKLLDDEWKKVNGQWRYFAPRMLTDGLYYVDDVWTYFYKSGNYTYPTLKEGWNKIDGKWFYVIDGNPVTYGIEKIGNDFYGFSSEMVTNRFYDGYYFGADGKLVKKQWIKYEGDWYYANAQGEIYRGQTRVIGGTKYTFDEYGRLV